MKPDPALVSMQSIAVIRSCYPQRFGIPRQSGLVTTATATVDFEATRDNELALRDIESFSHLWIIFLFHQQNYPTYKPLVQPPRLGGKKTMGVFATRSPNRINPIGLSAVQLDRVEQTSKEIKIHILGGDFLDGTPVLDIKPYLPFADSIPEADSAWAGPVKSTMPVVWHDEALSVVAVADQGDVGTDGLKTLIEETIALDPRPAHERNKDGRDGQTWGARVGSVDVQWQVSGGVAMILSALIV